ncbi:hypothetical protein FOL46_009712 [Perkinsus olseni]|nr:hypothetical protein FOL46_009712 [Perkinsus olseni]
MRPFLGWAASVIGLCAAMGGIRECLSAYSPAPENPSNKRKRSSSGPSEKKRRLSSGEPSRKIEEKDCRMKNITHVRDDGVSIEYCSINGMTLQKNFFYTSKKTANGNEKYFTITCAGSSFQT